MERGLLADCALHRSSVGVGRASLCAGSGLVWFVVSGFVKESQGEGEMQGGHVAGRARDGITSQVVAD